MAMHIQQNYDTKPKKQKKASSYMRSVCDETSVYIYMYVYAYTARAIVGLAITHNF